MPKLTEDAVDCGVCDDISLSETKIEHDSEPEQINDEIEMEDFLNMEMVTCENDSFGEEAASNTNSFKRYSAEEMISQRSLKRPYNSRFDQDTWNLQNEMKAHNEKEDKVMKKLLKAVSDAVHWWILEIAYKGKASCENKDCDQAFRNEVDMLFHWLRCRLTIYYPSFNLYKMNEDEDSIRPGKGEMAKELKARWPVRQIQESPAAIRAADAAAHQDSRAQETLEQSQSCRNADAAANRISQEIARPEHQQQAIRNEAPSCVKVGGAEKNCGPLTIICQFSDSGNFAAEQPSDGKFTSCSKLQSVEMNEGEDPILLRKRQMAKERRARWLAKQTQESLAAIRATDAAAHRYRRARETLEESQARRNANAAARRHSRARETLEQSQARRDANAAAHRYRRAQETLEETQARRNANAAALRKRRAQETLEESQARRTADAALHRNRRARETLEQSQARKNADAAAHRNRRAREVGVEQHNCGPMNIISQFYNSRNFAAERPSDGKFTICSKLQSVSSSVSTDTISENVLSQLTAFASEPDRHARVTANGAAVDNSCLLFKPAISFEPDLYENEKQFEEVLLPHSLSEARQLTASTEDRELCTFSEGTTELGSDCRSQVITSVGSCSSRTSPISDHTNTDGFRLMLKSEIKVEPGILESDQEPDKISNDDFCS